VECEQIDGSPSGRARNSFYLCRLVILEVKHFRDQQLGYGGDEGHALMKGGENGEWSGWVCDGKRASEGKRASVRGRVGRQRTSPLRVTHQVHDALLQQEGRQVRRRPPPVGAQHGDDGDDAAAAGAAGGADGGRRRRAVCGRGRPLSCAGGRGLAAPGEEVDVGRGHGSPGVGCGARAPRVGARACSLSLPVAGVSEKREWSEAKQLIHIRCVR